MLVCIFIGQDPKDKPIEKDRKIQDKIEQKVKDLIDLSLKENSLYDDLYERIILEPFILTLQ